MGTSTQFFFPTQIFNDLLKNEVSDSYYELKKINESHPILKEIKAMY